MVTVFTPTYNRGYIIENLYKSLCRQTEKHFEWLIVNDGSTDNTRELVAQFQSEGILEIHYIEQPNGGKHRAINRGAKEAKGEVFFIVDSDDSLADNAVERVVKHFNDIRDDDSFCGVCGMRSFPNGERMGGALPWNLADKTWIEYWIIDNIKGELAFAFKTDIIQKYEFDDFPNENFCAESLILNRMGNKYKIRFFNELIYISEYLEDGLTFSSIKNRRKSPHYAMTIYKEMTELKISIKDKIRAAVNYWRFYFCLSKIAKQQFQPKIATQYMLFKPLGLAMYIRDSLKYEIKIHKYGQGGVLFNKLKWLINILVWLFSFLPNRLNLFLFNTFRSTKGNVGIFLRYVLLKNLTYSCGENVVIKENVYLYNLSNLSIGHNVSIHPMCYIDCVGGVTIGNNVSIAHSSSIISFTHTYMDNQIPIKYNKCLSKSIIIKDDVWIGCGVRILYGVSIATRCIVGAGSVLNTDTEANSIYAGVPAKKVKNINLSETN